MSDRGPVDGGELEYEVRGSGEPVLLIHGAMLADAFTPLLAQPTLTDHYRLIHYHRRGFAGSCRHAGPCGMSQQAVDARALLDHLGIEHAHVVGHS
jgi:pimeloyl-ACP methyl ester carboxylesterase